ncbi:putative vitellogenin receptor isoform X2 [Drosophila guanche]|uniref:Blast:Putative vitellogenin receptor n=1 Tax=Drosophila guanche TaxID=7266 RepID=A0A3B0JXJ9_DROGU|nr:putative vitellogenin receptor isoform X2 [Drosophila guanche]SPP86795.1 blast:Putative vitellogenin receptor [Drosophila guanche]
MRSSNWQMHNLTSHTATVCNGVGNGIGHGNGSNANTSCNCYNVRRQRYGGHGPTQPQLSGRPIWWCRLAMLLLIFCALAASASGPANTRCNEEQFQCRDGSCILQAKMCDGRNDCTDATDELDCDYKLCREPHWFPCAQPHGACLAAELKCNGIDNCPGGEDELNCPVSARFASYRRLPARNCSLSQYMCQRDRSCIPIEFQCDGKSDCADSSDELDGCSTQSAASCSGHLCPNGRCLQRKQWLCDGVDDCGDGSDEHGCVDLCKPQLGKFMCRNKEQCLQLAQVCNGHSDCMDGSDESETCNIKPDCSSKTCPPAATCHMMPVDGAHCYCPAGFRLAKFGNKCVDIDECQERESELCSQSCENTSGGYRCLCDPGYQLARDNRTCRATISNASEHPLLLYTTQMNVMGMQLGSGQQHWSRHHVYQVAGNLSKVIGVAYDGSHVYWTNIQNEAESIVKAKSDGSHSEILLTSGLDAPEDLAVDWLTQNIYFSDNEMRHIAVCSHDAHNCVVLVTEDVHQPRGLALWPQRGQMFWTDWGVKPMIVRASMNGERSTPIVSDNIHWPNGIVVDMHQQRIYWVDAKLGSIQTVRPDGTGRRTVLDGILKHPYGLAVYEDQLYWSDWVTKSIHACHKYSGKQHRVLAKDSAIYAVHIYHPAKQPQTPNACASARCSHLCLLAEPEAGGHSCACPDGMLLASDQQRCMQMVKRQRLFVGVGQYLLEIEHTAFGRHVVSASHALDCVISEMVYNSVNGSLIIADNERHIIVEYQPEQGRAQGQGHGQPLRTLIRSNLGNVSALAFDHISENLYWADAERRVLELFSFHTRHRALIRFFAGQESPIGLSVMPADGYLFVALKARRQSYIDRLPLSGRGTPTHVFEDELGDDDIKMATDYEHHMLYWSDSDMGMIKYTNYRQTQELMFRNKLRRPYSLALVHQDLFWSELGSASIYWAHKSNMGPRKRIDVVPTRGDGNGDGDMHGQYPMSMRGAPWRLSLAASVSIGEEQQLHQQQHPCRQQNGGCSHICVGVGRLAATCLCPVGFVYRDASNRTCLEALDCEFRCHSSGECLTLAHRCNGRQDCVDRSDELDCDEGHKPRPKVMCTNRQFACHNAEDCVEKNKRCDGHKDCPDNSDELHCSQFDKTKSCHAHQLACDNGKCVDQSLMCDGKNDCGDNTDENPSKCDSPASCDLGMFQCSSGACIAGSWECDGQIDCSDASDEHDKCGQRQCPANMHRCMLGQCLDRRLVCDGHNDCGDMTDELNCGIHDLPSKANLCGNLYQCASNLKICLDPAVRCNGTAECPRGEDEADCGDMCSINEFQCRSEKQCIRKEFRCDRAKDCSDGSDEENCDKIQNQTLSQPWTAASRACRPHLFDCHDGECVDMSRVCNSFPDCQNGNDEGPLCATACKASSVGGARPVCQHKCRATPTGAVCSCFDGYRLDTDQRSCVDVNECLEGNQPCAQICENTLGGFQCQCHADFMLHQDRVSCKSLQAGATLLFSSYNEVRNLSEQPMMLQVAWSANDSRIDGFDVDMERQLGYFSSEEQGIVYQVDMRRGSVTRALAVPSPTKLAVDWATGNVYVLAGGSAAQEIYACSFTARMCGRILQVKTHMHLRHLAIDGYHGRLFYIAMRLEGFGHASAEVHVARLDGSHKELMLHKKDSYMTALALDPHQQQLYFLDMHSRTLERISYRSRSGSGPHRRPEMMVQKSPALKQPSGLSIYENQAYIVNLGSKEAVRCRLYGERICKSINLNVNNAQDIVVAGKSRQPMPATNPCQHSHCHGMCILADYGYECMCGSQLVAEGEQCPHGSSSELEVGASRQDRPRSSASSIQRWLMALLMLVVGSLAVGLGYMYFRWRQRGHTDLNINLHFQNPLSTIGSKAFIDHERNEASVGINGNGMDGMASSHSHSSSETGTTSASSSFAAQQFGMPNVLQRMLRPKQTSSSQMATEMLLKNSRASELYTLDNGRKSAGGGGGRVQDILVADIDDDAATGGSFGGGYAGDDANARLVP